MTERRRELTQDERREYRERCAAVEEALAGPVVREGANLRVLCPFCTSSKTGRADHSMNVAAATGVFHCFRCDTKGKLRRAPDPAAAELADAQAAARRVVEIEPPEGFIPLGYEPGLSAESLADARAYARKRHITPVLARELKVGAVLDGYYAGRLVIPVLAADGATWHGWVARDWTGRAERPYLYPRGMPRGAHMFNGDALAEETDAPCLIVEGVLDAVPFWPDAAAVLGKPSKDHAAAMAAARRPVVVCLDGDAWREGWALAARLRLDGARAGFIHMPPRKDPDEMVAWVREEMTACLDRDL